MHLLFSQRAGRHRLPPALQLLCLRVVLRELEVVLHLEHGKEALHDVVGDGAHVDTRDKGVDARDLFFAYAVDAQRGLGKALQLALERKVHVAFALHVAAHQTRAAYVELVEVAFPKLGEPVCKDLVEHRAGLDADEVDRGGDGVGLYVDVADVFVELGYGELQRSLYGVGIDRRQVRLASGFARRCKLAAKHRLRELEQDGVFGREDVLVASARHAGFLDDLAYRRGVVALLDKEPHACRENLALGFETVFALCHLAAPCLAVSYRATVYMRATGHWRQDYRAAGLARLVCSRCQNGVSSWFFLRGFGYGVCILSLIYVLAILSCGVRRCAAGE